MRHSRRRYGQRSSGRHFNAIATFHNTRLEVIPDRWVAGLARLRPQALIAATDFERAEVSVELSPAG